MMNIIVLFLSLVVSHASGSPKAEKAKVQYISERSAAGLRLRDPNFFNFVGHQVFKRKECGTGCQTGRKSLLSCPLQVHIFR